MNGGGKRQLPSWMIKPCSVEQTSVSEVRQEEHDNVASQTQKKAKRKKRDLVAENKLDVPEKSRGRKRDKKSSHEEECPLEDESNLLKKCKTRKSRRLYKEDDDLSASNLETDDDSARKRYQGKPPGKKKEKKRNISMEDSSDGIVNSEDELTVEDLRSIAEEYVNADMKKKKNLQISSEMRSSTSMTEKDPIPTVVHEEDRNSDSDEPLSPKHVCTDPLDMIDLLFGGLLKKSQETQRKNDALTENIMLDYELSKTSRNDSVVEAEAEAEVEVIPVMKKVSLKDKVAMFLD